MTLTPRSESELPDLSKLPQSPEEWKAYLTAQLVKSKGQEWFDEHRRELEAPWEMTVARGLVL